MVGLKTQNDLEIALRRNMWLGRSSKDSRRLSCRTVGSSPALSRRQSGICVANNRPSLALKDVDLIYFDEQDLSFEAEASHERRLRDLFQHLPIKLDVKNDDGAAQLIEAGSPVAPVGSSY